MNNIRYASLNDASEIKKIIDEGISENYYSIDTIKNYIIDENSYLLVAVSENDTPLAAMFCEKGCLKDMCRLENIPYPDETFDKYNEQDITIVYKTVATYKDARCNGLVHGLFRKYEDIFNSVEHDLRIGLALILPDGTIPIKKHIDEVGFSPKKIINSPWSNIKSFCTYCGNEYCKCNGMLIIKENRLGS